MVTTNLDSELAFSQALLSNGLLTSTNCWDHVQSAQKRNRVLWFRFC